MTTPLTTPDDKAFIRAIINAPGDVAPRLVYADWLDEQDTDDTRRAAEYLRTLAELTQLHPDSPQMHKVRTKLRKLEPDLPQRWLAILDVPLIEACAAHFRFACPKRWDSLLIRKDAFVRECLDCQREVHYCHTIAEAVDHAERGHCIAIPSGALRYRGDLTIALEKRQAEREEWEALMEEGQMFMGEFV